jgi:hypothetical protein
LMFLGFLDCFQISQLQNSYNRKPAPDSERIFRYC